MKNLCKCGCGTLIKEGNKFVQGHNSKGPWNKEKHHSKKTCEKISDTRKKLFKEGKLKLPKHAFKKGHIPWTKGKKLKSNPNTKAQNIKISETRKRLISEGKIKLKTLWTGETCPRLYGDKNPSKRDDVRKKISEANRGRKHTKLARQKMSDAHMGKKCSDKRRKQMSIISKNLWKNSDYRDKITKAILKGLNRRPNNPETKIINIIKKYNLPFKYVGDGKVIIHGLNPDFINCNGKKQIIEVFGDYWHKNKSNLRPFQTEKGRKAIFKKYGFKTLIIWEHELTGRYGNKSTEEEIVNKIINFTGDGL